MCKRQLKSNIENTITVKLTPKWATVNFDLWKIPYKLKRTKVEDSNILHNLFKQYDDKAKQSYYSIGLASGEFHIPTKNVGNFLTELKEILTDLDNIEPIKVEW